MPHPLVPALLAAMAAAAGWASLTLSEARASGRFTALEKEWRAYATARGLTFVSFAQLSGVPSDVGPPLVQGEVQGVGVELTVRSSTRPMTRAEATLPGVSPDFVMLIRRRGPRFLRALGRRRLADVPTGNQAFDAAFTLRSNDPDLARSLVDRRLARMLLAFPRVLREVRVSRNRLTICWRGMETDAAVLDAAVELSFTACRRRA